MLKDEISKITAEVESLVGREFEMMRGLIQQESLVAFENLCMLIDDEPVALTTQQLERLRSIASRLDSDKCLTLLDDIRPDDPYRSWMNEESVAVAQTDWEPLAEQLRSDLDFERVLPSLRELLGRSPSTVELTRFVRMIVPEASFEVAAKATSAIESGKVSQATGLLDPWRHA